jgi:hypothetical protein
MTPYFEIVYEILLVGYDTEGAYKSALEIRGENDLRGCFAQRSS